MFQLLTLITPVVFLFIYSAETVCAQENTMRLFSRNHFSAMYPSKWKVDTSRFMGSEVFFSSPLEGKDDKFAENISVVIADAKEFENELEEFGKSTEKKLKEIFKQITFNSSSMIRSEGKKYYAMDYELQQGKLNLRIVSRSYMMGDKVYIIAFSSEENTYDNYKEISEKILNSFQLIR